MGDLICCEYEYDITFFVLQNVMSNIEIYKLPRMQWKFDARVSFELQQLHHVSSELIFSPAIIECQRFAC